MKTARWMVMTLGLAGAASLGLGVVHVPHAAAAIEDDLRESRYEAKTTELLPGDILVWYTDGIVECENPAGEEYGEKRFRASVRRAAALDAGEMRDAVVADSITFFGDTLRKDDITLVVGRIH